MTTHPDHDPTTVLASPTRAMPARSPQVPPRAPYAPSPAVPMVPRTNGLAIAALVTGLCGLAIIPVILGHMGLGQIRRTGESGTALAVIGLVLGYGMLALYTVAVAAAIGGSVWLFTS